MVVVVVVVVSDAFLKSCSLEEELRFTLGMRKVDVVTVSWKRRRRRRRLRLGRRRRLIGRWFSKYPTTLPPKELEIIKTRRLRRGVVLGVPNVDVAADVVVVDDDVVSSFFDRGFVELELESGRRLEQGSFTSSCTSSSLFGCLVSLFLLLLLLLSWS